MALEGAIERQLGKLSPQQPTPFQKLSCLDTLFSDKSVYTDSSSILRECVRRLGGTKEHYEAEMLLPLPEPVEISHTDFFTPFPIMVEMPVLNLSNDIKGMLNCFLDEIGKCDRNQLKIVHELISLYPNLLSRNYLSSNFGRLIEENGEVMEHIFFVLAQQRADIFNELLKRLAESARVEIATIELMFKLSTKCTVEQRYLDIFVERCFLECKGMDGPARKAHLKMVCEFVCHLIRRGLFDCKSKTEAWLTYCTQYKSNKYVNEFRKFVAAPLNK